MTTQRALDEPLSKLLGPKTAKALAKGLDLHTVEDLLRHYPRRYAERGVLTTLAHLEVGEQVTVMAEVLRVDKRSMRNRRGSLLEVTVTDGAGKLTLTFFNQHWRERDLKVGRRGLFAGKVGEFRGQRQLANPEYQLLADPDAFDAPPLGLAPEPRAPGVYPVDAPDVPSISDELDDIEEFAGALIPVYPATGSLPTWKIGQCVRLVLDTVGDLDVVDPLPEDVRTRHGLVGLDAAYRLIHRPETQTDWQSAQERFRFEEAFVLQTVLAQRRANARQQPAQARAAQRDGDGLLAAFDRQLPYTLTDGQRDVGDEIFADLARSFPMHRLLQGEVGSGKTLVAVRAMLAVVDAGGQAVLLAPTEVLAQQHLRSLTQLLGPLAERGFLGGAELSTRIALVTGSLGAAARRQALLEVASGDAGIVIGTHALLEDTVIYQDLGLVVVDEQHRFGVEQRAALLERGEHRPHVLVMTATPIPRTVAMTVFGDLETSTLSELPKGRAPITTHVVPTDKPQFLDRVWTRAREEIGKGHQVYVVCPRIGDAEGSDELEPIEDEGARRPPLAVVDVVESLRSGPLKDERVEVLHGRMPSDAKDDVMRRFGAGDIDVLVATTVIEVGVDVANASMMVVMDAERFGVSQLHQLRGRVGRGSVPGLCLLVTDAPDGSPGRERLNGVASTVDGFELARLDLEQRREGDVLGATQSGRRSSLRLLSVIRHEDVIVTAREDAESVVAADPSLTAHPNLAAVLDRVLEEQAAEYLEKS